jgi:hypothetical protein
VAAAGGCSGLRLLLDEMYDPQIARELKRLRGIDALELGELRGMPDAAVFGFAQFRECAVVTENIVDFVPLAGHAISSGAGHHGLILTSNASFPCARPSTTGAIVKALAALSRKNGDVRGQIIWLQPEN